jgi:cyclomaltodextrinase / maltogenic alpha-amylase / neopullulanase
MYVSPTGQFFYLEYVPTGKYTQGTKMKNHWINDAIFYHIYPLGFCSAPERNDFASAPVPRLEKIYEWIPHLRGLGVNALYLGPLFESTAHGYDTADYFHVDRRLGTDQTLANLVGELHRNGIRVILDGVFNHVGRDFWAFRDLRQNGQASRFCSWFQEIDFSARSQCGDAFRYEGWNGNFDLVKLNPHSPEVRDHLFHAIRQWVEDFDIDGLRLDVADCLNPQFMRELSAFCHTLKPDFWLMGEVVHGDYNKWANPAMLDSVTNYEAYKGLYSSLADKNYFEIAYSLKRQFGQGGIYRDLALYNFADNHDVNRVASNLKNPRHLYPLYCLLFTMPGVPSIYYGSEWGLEGLRTPADDRPLRPALDLNQLRADSTQPDLPAAIGRFASIRRDAPALQHGDYKEVFVASEQFAFARSTESETVIVLLNAADHDAPFDIPLAMPNGTRLVDLLNPGDEFRVEAGRLRVEKVHSCWGRILKAG